jgi:hypothetical protein
MIIWFFEYLILFLGVQGLASARDNFFEIERTVLKWPSINTWQSIVKPFNF